MTKKDRHAMVPLGVLLQAARRLDQRAIIAIYDLFAPGLYKFVSRFVEDLKLVDQMVTDEFTQLLEEFAAGKGPRGNLRCYLYQSAYRRMVETNESPSLKIVLRTPQRDKAVHTTADAEEQAKLQSLVSAMNTALSDDQRIVLILRFLEDFTMKETAEMLMKELGNIKAIQSRGLTRLRKALGMAADETLGNWTRL